MKKGERFADPARGHIDYCLNILGIRVWEKTCQLIAKGDGHWEPIGPTWDLPIEIPTDDKSLKHAGNDTMRLTAWQYANEHPGTDIREVLSQKKSFADALQDH
jgi:hypothetical protein